MKLAIVPCTFDEAAAFIRRHHSHHKPPLSAKFSIAVALGEVVVGVATVGRPVARGYDDGWTVEITRVCTDRTEHAASKLVGGCINAAWALGYRRVVTYTLDTEKGTSCKAAGMRVIHKVPGRSWDCPSRPRVDKHPTQGKLCWEVTR